MSLGVFFPLQLFRSFRRIGIGAAIMAQWLTNPTSIHEDAGLIPGLLSGLRIWHCCELWCRLQMRLGSYVAMAVI